MGNLAYSSVKGKTITESALSQSLNKECLIENLSNKNVSEEVIEKLVEII